MSTRNMRLKLKVLLGATLVSNIGSAMSVLALGKMFYDKTGSMAGFAWAFALEQMIQVFGLYCAGPLSDRLNSRKVAIAADLVRGVFFCLSAVLVMMTQNPMYAYASVMAGGLFKPFHRAAMFRWLPTLAEGDELFKLNSAYGSAVQTGGLVGSGVAGLLMMWMSAPCLILIDGVSYLLSATILITFSSEVHALTDSVLRHKKRIGDLLGFSDWRACIALLRSRVDLCAITAFNAFDYVIVGVFNVFLVPYVAIVLKAPPIYISLIDGFFAAGSLLLVYSQRFVNFKASSKISYSLGFGLMAAGFLGLAEGAHTMVACLATLAIGYGQRLVFTCNTSNLQRATPASYRGRVAVVRLALASLMSALVVAPSATFLKQNVALGLVGFAIAIVLVWVTYMATHLDFEVTVLKDV